jgi:type I restriction enzyme M protein
MPPTKKSTNGTKTGANLGFEATLWAAAGKMRNNMGAGGYQHAVPPSSSEPATYV